MSLKDKIESHYNNSIKEKDSNSINTLRLIKSAIKDKEISLRGKQDALTDSDILSLLQSLVKQRKDSIEAFEKANRNDLIENELNEIKVIEMFLPKQMDEDETKMTIKSIIQENNFIFEAAHPSPLSANNGFFGCAHFSNEVATGFLSTTTLTFFASNSFELIFIFTLLF